MTRELPRALDGALADLEFGSHVDLVLDGLHLVLDFSVDDYDDDTVAELWAARFRQALVAALPDPATATRYRTEPASEQTAAETDTATPAEIQTTALVDLLSRTSGPTPTSDRGTPPVDRPHGSAIGTAINRLAGLSAPTIRAFLTHRAPRSANTGLGPTDTSAPVGSRTDVGELIELLAHAFVNTGDPLFRARIEETVAWLGREMVVEGGAIAASLDADSEGVEGRFYVWSLAEITDILGEDDGKLFAEDTKGCLAYAEENEVIALIGVQDLVVVRAGNATLVCPRDRAQDVKRIVERLKDEGKEFL